MTSEALAAPVPKAALWVGRILSALVVLTLLFSGTAKVMKFDGIVGEFERLGYGERVILAIGIVEIVCALLYAFPRTSVLGAILLTGYLGGATATHVRIGEQFLSPLIVGILVWGGLYLRDRRLRALLPVRSSGS
jgi:hypothetical protein